MKPWMRGDVYLAEVYIKFRFYAALRRVKVGSHLAYFKWQMGFVAAWAKPIYTFNFPDRKTNQAVIPRACQVRCNKSPAVK